MSDEFACIEDSHYIHLGVNPNTGKPCNSSVVPAYMCGLDNEYDDDEDEWPWHCLGCSQFFKEMPEMESEGLNAIRHMHEPEIGGEP